LSEALAHNQLNKPAMALLLQLLLMRELPKPLSLAVMLSQGTVHRLRHPDIQLLEEQNMSWA
jgi:hypothetical protein